MRLLLIFPIVLLMSNGLFAQPNVNYNDVAVIVNDNSPVSVSIGDYFQQQRSIPVQNIIHVTAPTTEAIDSLEFEDLRLQIETYLLTNNLADSINYIVTTKGVPLNIVRSNCLFMPPGNPNCTSVDSELTLILSSSSNSISSVGQALNFYYTVNDHFDRTTYDMYLVTRLDGYTVDDVKSLIDRSGPNTNVNQASNNMVFDVSIPVVDSTYFITNVAQPAMNIAQNAGWNTILDTDSTRLLNQDNVFTYANITYVVSPNSINYGFVPASIAEIVSASSYETFDASNPSIDQNLADLIAEGLTGGHGYLYPTYFSIILNQETLFERYIDTASHYNLAESYYMSIPRLSWNDVVIGDPKTSIVIDNTASLNDPEKFKLSIGPNPSNGSFTVFIEDIKINSIRLIDNIGRLVYQDDPMTSQNIKMDLNFLGSGRYIIILDTDQGHIQQPIIIE